MLIFTSTLYNHSCRGVFVPLPTSLVLTVVFHQPLDGLPILYGHSCFNDYHHETVKMYLATNIIMILIEDLETKGCSSPSNDVNFRDLFLVFW